MNADDVDSPWIVEPSLGNFINVKRKPIPCDFRFNGEYIFDTAPFGLILCVTFVTSFVNYTNPAGEQNADVWRTTKVPTRTHVTILGSG